jgi:hypothetical protein
VPEPETQPIEIDAPAAPARRRGRLAAVGVVAVVAAGAAAFGISTLGASDGADSPEAAVDAFLAAVDDEDVIGVLEAVDPVERVRLQRAIEGSITETDRGEITADVDLRDVSGAEMEVDGVEHDSEMFTDDLAAVDLTAGRVDAGASIADLPFGRTVTEVLGADPSDPGTAEIDLAGLRVMTVQRDGSWYVSPSYTGAEAIRRAADPEPPLPAFGTFAGPAGADSPEDAVRALAEAIDDVDIDAMVATTSPTLAPVLHDYAPVLVDAAGDTDPESVVLTDLALVSEPRPDGTSIVRVTRFELSIAGSYETITRSLVDGCITTTVDVVDHEGHEGPEGVEVFGYPQSVNSCDTGQGGLGSLWFAGPFGIKGESLSFVTVQENGRWFIDPLDSLAEDLVGSLRDSSTEELHDLVYFWTGAFWMTEPDEFWAACGVERPGPDVGEDAGWNAYDQCVSQLPEDYDGPWGPFGNIAPTGERVTCMVYSEEPAEPATDECAVVGVEGG